MQHFENEEIAFLSLSNELIEGCLGFLNVPDLLHASATSKALRTASLAVLGNFEKLSFRLIPSHLMLKPVPAALISRRMISLQSLQLSPGNSNDLLQQLSVQERLSVQQRCSLTIFPFGEDELEENDLACLPAMSSIRKLDLCVASASPRLLQFIDSQCPLLDECAVLLPLPSEQHAAVAERLLSRCSALHLSIWGDADESSLPLLRKWRTPRSLVFSWGKSDIAVQALQVIGMDRMRRCMESLAIALDASRDVVEALFPSAAPSAASPSTCNWPALRKLDVAFGSDCPAGVLETVVSHCPALTDLTFSCARVRADPSHSGSFCLSEQSLSSLAERLLSLSATVSDSRWIC